MMIVGHARKVSDDSGQPILAAAGPLMAPCVSARFSCSTSAAVRIVQPAFIEDDAKQRSAFEIRSDLWRSDAEAG